MDRTFKIFASLALAALVYAALGFWAIVIIAFVVWIIHEREENPVRDFYQTLLETKLKMDKEQKQHDTQS